MGTARRLTDQEVKEWMVKIPYSKQDLKFFKSSTHQLDLRADGITQEQYDRRRCQQRYEYSDRLTIKGIKAFPKLCRQKHILYDLKYVLAKDNVDLRL